MNKSKRRRGPVINRIAFSLGCVLDARFLMRKGLLVVGKTGMLAWTRGEGVEASVGFLMQERGLILTYAVDGKTKGQLLPIIHRGASPGFKCGGCARHVGKLILNEKAFECVQCSASTKTELSALM